jgi:drug/metabolite transporter (DMT)-like permease
VKLRHVYLIACAVGLVLPLYELYPFLQEHGLDVGRFVSQSFSNPSSASLAADVMCSGVVLILFMLFEGQRLGMKRRWWPLLGLAIGVSLAFPWFLYLRQAHLDGTTGSRQ